MAALLALRLRISGGTLRPPDLATRDGLGPAMRAGRIGGGCLAAQYLSGKRRPPVAERTVDGVLLFHPGIVVDGFGGVKTRKGGRWCTGLPSSAERTSPAPGTEGGTGPALAHQPSFAFCAPTTTAASFTSLGRDSAIALPSTEK
ncbi:hypothetical protein GCM10018775_67580 [Streptomyces umbrinus]|nr:hypothetical protein GCM10018775_67580 [Streptomyces umbrinus]